MNLSEWIQHKKNQAAYTAWKNSEVTKVIVEGLRARVHMTMHGVVNGDDALKAVGFHSGKDATLDIMENLLDLVTAGGEPIHRKATLESYLVNSEGYTPAEAREIAKRQENA